MKKESVLKLVLIGVIGFLLFITAVLIALILFDTWRSLAYISYVLRESEPGYQIVFMSIMLFNGLYVVKLLTGLINWR